MRWVNDRVLAEVLGDMPKVLLGNHDENEQHKRSKRAPLAPERRAPLVRWGQAPGRLTAPPWKPARDLPAVGRILRPKPFRQHALFPEHNRDIL